MEEEEEIDRVTGEFSEERSSVFSQLKPYCIELLELVQNPKKHPSSIPSLLHCLRSSPPHALYPFFDYVLFPLLLLLDVAVDCRSSQKEDSKENISTYDVPKVPQKVSDRVVEGVLQCLEELLTKCHLGSVDQMVVVLKKLTFAALLSPSEASEEFREGVIKCFKSLLLGLLPCSDQSCSCKQITGLPELMESGNLQALLTRPSKHDSRPGECLLVFLQSQTASAAVGHWLSLLLKAADIEAARGHQGSAKLRIEAFMTLRILVAKVGIADALAFFLPGVVSQFAKVLHVSKTMISGAGGSVEATNQAIRGLAEYIMIVLQDDANLSSLDSIRTGGFNSDIYESTNSFLEELRKLPIKAQRESESVAEDVNGEVIEALGQKSENIEKKRTSSGKEIGTLHVNRTREWIQKTSSHLNKLFCATLPHICVHPAKQVRKGLLVALQGLLSRCSHTLKESRLMLLECLCVLVVDVFEEVSSASQEFLVYLFSSSEKHHIEHEVAEIFSRLIAKLPTVVLGNEESLALSHAQKLLVVMYYSGPQFVMDHIQSPVTAARFLDVFAVCLSQNASFTGSLDKVMIPRRSSIGYLHSIAELKPGSLVTGNFQTIINATSSDISKATDFQVKDMRYQLETMQKKYELPRMPPWFVGSQKLYLALSGILRLVGSSLTADFRSEGHLMVITDIPLGYLRRLVSEVRVKEYSNQSWKYWCDRTGSGQLIRQASTAACILNEMIFGLSDHAVDIFTRMFQKSRMEKEEVHESHMGFDDQPHEHEISVINKSMWKISQNKSARSLLIDCIGKILHEYLSPEVWNLPIDHKSYLLQLDSEVGDISLHFFCDIAMLHQVIIEGIGIFALCLGKDFASSGFLHSSLYLLLEKLICSNFQVRSSSDAVLHVLAAASGYPTVGQLVLANADYVIDSICRQLRHLDLNPHVPNVLAAMLSYIGVAHKVLPLLEEPMLSVSQELEILGRHQHPDLTLSFLKALAEIVKASKHEAYCLPTQAKAYLKHVESKISYMDKNSKADFGDASTPHHDTSFMKPEQWEKIMFELNDSKRYRRTVGSIAGSCLIAATPLLASVQQAACLLALDIVENGIATLAKVEEAYRCETETKEKIEEVIQSYFLYELKDTLDAAQDGTDDNRLLPAMNKIWPFLVICIQNRNPVAATKCLSLVSSVVQICGGDFFSRRFLTDGPHFWNLLSTSPFQKKPRLKDEKMPLLLPYRSTSVSLEDSVAEVTHLKVQVALLNMIADLSRNQRSASALDAVLKKVSGLVVGIACSGVVGLQDASVNALHGLASIDPDLIWLLLADVYYSMKKKDKPPPPTSDLQDLSQILPPPLSQKEFLYVQYGGQTYGFDIDFSSVETVYKKMQSLVFTNQMYS